MGLRVDLGSVLNLQRSTGNKPTGNNIALAIEPRLLYITDPLCGWCYAFGHALKEAYAPFRDRLGLHVLLGGMMTGERAGPLGARGTAILESLPRLERITGVRMGAHHQAMLREGTQWLSSLLPSRAVVAFRELEPAHTFDFLHRIQQAHFQDGADLNEPSLYAPIATSLGADEDLFTALFDDERSLALAEEDFAMVAAWGVDGFPTLAAEVGTRFYGLAHGYRNAADLSQLFEAILRVDPTSA